MFHSFFPRPKWFFSSLVIWTALGVAVWYAFWRDFGVQFSMGPMNDESKPTGLGYFVTPDSLWFYGFFIGASVMFCGFWQVYAREARWRTWSIWGSAFILFVTKYSVEVSLAINHWQRPFFDKIQLALSGPGKVKPEEFYFMLGEFLQIAVIAVTIFVLAKFITSHYLFRWRSAMNDYYMAQWQKLRSIEGASQRVQEDTMNFATYAEDLGASFVTAIMTLIAFLPLLFELSKYVKVIPVLGEIPAPLFFASIFWSAFGTALLWLAGIKLPGLEFHNQRVEAALRKELVHGEDDHSRAEPMTIRELFENVRRNYFRLYFHYLYFRVVMRLYQLVDNIFVYFILIPSFSAAAFSLGVMYQIFTAFGEVSSSFQYLVNSWTDIIKLQSIYKRLRAFEAAIHDEPLPEIERTASDEQEAIVSHTS